MRTAWRLDIAPSWVHFSASKSDMGSRCLGSKPHGPRIGVWSQHWFLTVHNRISTILNLLLCRFCTVRIVQYGVHHPPTNVPCGDVCPPLRRLMLVQWSAPILLVDGHPKGLAEGAYASFNIIWWNNSPINLILQHCWKLLLKRQPSSMVGAQRPLYSNSNKLYKTPLRLIV
jgi:hypothetical protein